MATKDRDVLGDSRKRYLALGQRYENTDRAKNQSDCRIRYRALKEKINGNINTIFFSSEPFFFPEKYII